MNDPPIDVTESIIDIFILSVSEPVTSLFTEHLEKKGYRVTLFTDGNYLLETLREGKPNLLICDTTTLDKEGFDVCCRIKDDDDLWVIPVLILTRGSTLTDLLRVLDCNADNFITHPFDISYCLSVIDSMLSIPVERRTPDQIKTQFKISHNDQIYVVAANRRKLLEFLLSSFEITVNQSSELSRIRSELQTLSESARILQDRVLEQTRVVESIHETLLQKEQKISMLTYEVEEDKKILAQTTSMIEQLSEQRDNNQHLLITYEENLRKSIQEKKNIESALQSEIDALSKQISELLTEVDLTKTSLENVQGELDDEKIHCTSLECTLELLVPQKETAEKNLHTLTLEHEQLTTAFAEEKNRTLSLEQEIQKVIQEKTQAEQEFTLKINSLEKEVQQQVANLEQVKGELDVETNQRISLVNTMELLQQEKAQSDSALQSALNTLKGELGDLQEKYRSALAELETEQGKTTSLQKNLAEVVSEKEKNLDTLTLEYEQLKTAFSGEKDRALSAEQEIQKISQAKTQAEQELNLTITDLNETVKQQSLELTGLKSELDAEAKQRISSENQVEAIRQEKDKAESAFLSSYNTLKEQLSELEEKHERVRAELENEAGRTKSLKDNLVDIIAEKEKTEEMLKTDRDSYKATFLRLKHDLDEATAVPVTLERELIAVKSQNKALSDELNLAYQGKAQTSQQVHSLIEELEQLKAELASEQSMHRTTDASYEADKQNVQRLEQDLRKLSDEQASLNEILEQERRLRLDAEEKTKEAAQKQELLKQELLALKDEAARKENERTVKLRNLEAEFELVGDLQKSLESQVNNLKNEKSEAEKTIQALTDELDQARTALAEEWEDHMISVAAAYKERQRLQQSIPPAEGAETKNEKSEEISEQKPGLPAIVDSASHEIVTVPSPEIQKSPVSEDVPTSPETTPEIPVASPVPASGAERGIEEENPPEEGAAESDEEEEEELPESPVSAGETPEMASYKDDQAEADEEEEEPGEEYSDTMPEEWDNQMSHGVFTFSRSQWLDLLKWAHHSGILSHDQRIQIVRMGRLIQKDRKLTIKQQEQVNEMIALVQALGYRPSR